MWIPLAALLPVLVVIAAHAAELGRAWSIGTAGDWTGAGARIRSALAPLAVTTVAMMYAVPHALWAVSRIARRAEEASLALAMAHVDPIRTPTLARGLGSITGPVAMASAVGVIAAVATASWRGAVHLALAPALAILLLPQMTLVWVYLCVMLGLFRLGSRPLALEQYSGDRSLGLRPVGQVAFAGFWAFVSNFAPLALLAFGGRSIVDLLIVSAFLLLGTFAIFASLVRVRGQMVAAKRREAARARALYALAYEPLRSSPSLDVLARQAPVLAAAEALEKRAESIQSWPFSDALLARAVVIASSVATAVIARLAQRFLGV